MNRITVGTAVSQPGTIQYGQFDAFRHPTGHIEFFPVIIVQGVEEGPCMWLTAGIHGNEHTGPTILYQLITPELVAQLKGTLVIIPALSPAGLRTMSYVPYHAPKNPNRLWPDGRPRRPATNLEKASPTAIELAYERLFAVIQETANFLIDYHNFSIGSISFAFRDRVLYRADENAAAHQAEATALSERLEGMLQAYGHTIINEYPAEHYIDEDLHRSTSGAALLVARIPALTVELGTDRVPDLAIVRASLAGTRNVMRWAGMLPGDMEVIAGIPVIDPGYPVHRSRALRAAEPCVLLHLVQAGEMLAAGQPVAEVRDVWGRPLGEGVLRAQQKGFVMGRAHGIYYNTGDPVLTLAVADDSPRTGAYPADYFGNHRG